MNASDVLAAIRKAHPTAAIVHEVVTDDPEWLIGYGQEIGKSTRRIDALMFQSLQRTAIEIKVTKQDYNADTWAKRAPWARICHRFIYAMPADLAHQIQPREGCGVWAIEADGSITIVRKAKINTTPEPLPQQVVQALAYRASSREVPA